MTGRDLMLVPRNIPYIPDAVAGGYADRLLARCLSQEHIDAIASALRLQWDNGLPAPACPEPGTSWSPTYRVVSVGAAMSDLTFDTPMPIIGTTRPWDWLVGRGLQVILTRGEEYNSAGGNEVWLRSEDGVPAYPQQPLVMADPRTGAGAMHLMGLLMHEARHIGADGRPHNWEFGMDSGLHYRGAWAVQHYFFRWLAEHAPNGWLTPYERVVAAASAQEALERMGPVDRGVARMNNLCALLAKMGEKSVDAMDATSVPWAVSLMAPWIPDPRQRTSANACWAWARLDEGQRAWSIWRQMQREASAK